jgi:hypothetical protein
LATPPPHAFRLRWEAAKSAFLPVTKDGRGMRWCRPSEPMAAARFCDYFQGERLYIASSQRLRTEVVC